MAPANSRSKMATTSKVFYAHFRASLGTSACRLPGRTLAAARTESITVISSFQCYVIERMRLLAFRDMEPRVVCRWHRASHMCRWCCLHRTGSDVCACLLSQAYQCVSQLAKARQRRF